MRRPELLIPASSLEVLKIAVIYGADAVYIGGESFGLRAKAKNFSMEEMREGIRFAHEHEVKVYVTANILAHNDDLEGVREYFKELASFPKEEKPDALIIADPGIFMIAKEVCPDIERHVSTQANNTNYETYRFWYRLGAKRVVSARELSLNEIKELATPLFQDKPFIRNYQLEVQGHTTTTEWNGKESVEEYLKKREYEIETSIYLNEGKTDKEYAEELSYIMQEIVESDLVFNISVYTNDDNIIFYSLPEQHSQPDVEAILEKMEDVKRQQETKKDYKEWKKQNQNNETNSD